MAESPGHDVVQELEIRALEGLNSAGAQEELEEWRIAYLGRRGELTQLLRGLGSLEVEERRVVGAAANRLKSALEERLSEREQALNQSKVAGLGTDAIDVTLPGRPMPQGGLHPTTRVIREICDVFTSMGFDIVEGPEVEWDHYNFEMANIPKGHPARDMWNTLWVDYTDENGEQPMLLRTHTTPMQARIMENRQPPIRVVVPGKCYRYEATDATHEWHFYQIEGLAVDRGITFANLKGTLYELARAIFGQDRKVRFRCDYFPFVEPGVDMSIEDVVLAREMFSGPGLSVLFGRGDGTYEPETLYSLPYSHGLARAQRRLETRRSFWLHADDLGARARGPDVRRDPGQ